jgi:hypothetical protein
MDATGAGVVFVILLQLGQLFLLERLIHGPKEPKKEEPSDREIAKIRKMEEASEEVKRLKEVLADPVRIKDLALARFKGNVEKAKKEIREKLRKMTGEIFEAPIEK